ncbi:Arm DNA-binding domain-containing protein [Ghiorsea bivora]|nr:Arm DNA-binding domain-containing protein [Ghiorsea bivora]
MLPDVKICAVKLPEGKSQIKLTDGEGLYLLVLKSGKYWRFDYSFVG